jgi:D-alanyl-D-alanine dipeptidase
MGVRLYERPGAYLQKPAALALARVAERLRPMGLGLMIHDSYRPWFVTWMFWEATPPEGRIFTADPSKGSRHNRGAAVDLTLTDLKDGTPLEMTGGYDEMSSRSYPNYVGGSSLQRWRRDTLRSAMEAEGFDVYPTEWWHFDFRGWERYPILNLDFDEVERSATARASGGARR